MKRINKKFLLLAFACAFASSLILALSIHVDGNLAEETSVLAFRFADKQADALKNVRGVKVYFATQEDDVFSERQFRLFSTDVTRPCQVCEVVIPATVTSFRFDINRRPASAESDLLPVLDFVRVDGEEISRDKLVPFHNQRFKFSGYRVSRFVRAKERLPKRVTLLSKIVHAAKGVPVFQTVICSRVAWVAVMSAVFYLVGVMCMLVLRLRIPNFIMRITFANAVGFGMLGLLFSYMALLGAFGFWWLCFLLLAVLSVSVFVWLRSGVARDDCAFFVRISRRPFKLVLGMGFVVVLSSICFANCNCPPYQFDETEYHLAYAWQIFNNGCFANDLYMRFPFFTHTMHVAYAAVLTLFNDDVLPHYLSGWMLVIIAMALFDIVRRRDGDLTAFLSVLLFVFFRSLLAATSTAYIDIPLMFFAAFAFFAIIELSVKKEVGWLYVSAFLMGIDVSVKYQGILYLVLLAVLVLITLRIGKVGGMSKRETMWFFLIVFAVGCTWYVRNAVLSGNPISPFGSKFFGCWPWSEADHVYHDKVMRAGVRGWQSVLYLPYYMIFSPDKLFDSVPRITFATSILSLFFVVAFRGIHRILSIVLPVAIFFWAATSPFTRYAYLLCPFAAWQAVYTIIWVAKWVVCHKKIFYLSLLIVMIYIHLQYFNWVSSFSPCEDRNTFEILRFGFSVRPYKWMNANAPGKNLYVDGQENMRYFYKGHIIGDHFGPGRYSDFRSAVNDPDSLKSYVTKHKIDYFLVRSSSYAKLPSYSFLQKVYDDQEFSVYKVRTIDEIGIAEKSRKIPHGNDK